MTSTPNSFATKLAKATKFSDLDAITITAITPKTIRRQQRALKAKRFKLFTHVSCRKKSKTV